MLQNSWVSDLLGEVRQVLRSGTDPLVGWGQSTAAASPCEGLAAVLGVSAGRRGGGVGLASAVETFGLPGVGTGSA